MVTPDAKWLEVTRVGHNLGKIHDAESAVFELAYFEADGHTPIRKERLEIAGSAFRKAGLGKDVTDKFLSGLPGIQKEGCDGLITSARWLVHRMPAHTRTVCLEFFGNAKDAVPSIVDIKAYMFAEQKRSGTLLAGLEHLDDRYLRAVGYATKSKRGGVGLPKMVLIGDIVGDDADAVAKVTSEVVRLANGRSGEGFVAISPEARKKFWLDRKRTAAISKHTNIFACKKHDTRPQKPSQNLFKMMSGQEVRRCVCPIFRCPQNEERTRVERKSDHSVLMECLLFCLCIICFKSP